MVWTWVDFGKGITKCFFWPILTALTSSSPFENCGLSVLLTKPKHAHIHCRVSTSILQTQKPKQLQSLNYSLSSDWNYKEILKKQKTKTYRYWFFEINKIEFRNNCESIITRGFSHISNRNIQSIFKPSFQKVHKSLLNDVARSG